MIPLRAVGRLLGCSSVFIFSLLFVKSLSGFVHGRMSQRSRLATRLLYFFDCTRNVSISYIAYHIARNGPRSARCGAVRCLICVVFAGRKYSLTWVDCCRAQPGIHWLLPATPVHDWLIDWLIEYSEAGRGMRKGRWDCRRGWVGGWVASHECVSLPGVLSLVTILFPCMVSVCVCTWVRVELVRSCCQSITLIACLPLTARLRLLFAYAGCVCLAVSLRLLLAVRSFIALSPRRRTFGRRSWS